jgi:hypothetical protein
MFPGVERGVPCDVWCSLFVLPIDAQAGLEPVVVVAVVRNGTKFSHVMWCGKAFHGLGVQDVKSLILVGALFPFDGGRREGKKKEKKKKKKSSPWGRRVYLGLDPPCWLFSRSQLSC